MCCNIACFACWRFGHATPLCARQKRHLQAQDGGLDGAGLLWSHPCIKDQGHELKEIVNDQRAALHMLFVKTFTLFDTKERVAVVAIAVGGKHLLREAVRLDRLHRRGEEALTDRFHHLEHRDIADILIFVFNSDQEVPVERLRHQLWL